MAPLHEDKLILVADDDRDDQEFLRHAFQEARRDVSLEFVADGEALLDRLAASSAGLSPPPQLVLLDLNMPRLDGRSVLRKIRELVDFGAIPVVVLTTSKSPTDIDACYRGGCNSYCVKPPAFMELVDFTARLHDYWFSTSRLPRTLPSAAARIG